MTKDEFLERLSDKVLTDEEIKETLTSDEYCQLDIKFLMDSVTYVPYVEFSGKVSISSGGDPDYFKLVELLCKLHKKKINDFDDAIFAGLYKQMNFNDSYSEK